MPVCPCCKRRLPEPKLDATRKALREDLKRAEYNIHCLKLALRWPQEHVSFYLAVREELDRMDRATADYRLLWSIFRRNAKNIPSYAALPVDVKTECAA